MDDASILDLLLKRDESAIAELRCSYEKLCFSIAGNLLSPEDAEECVNTAFFDVWRNIPPEHPDDLKMYLCRIVKNKAIDRLKYNSAEKRNPPLTVSLDELTECIPDRNGGNISAEKLAGLISSFLRTQNEKHRKVFVRRYWYGDTLGDIAELYGMNEKTVATYLFRTRKKLKDHLTKEGYYHE